MFQILQTASEADDQLKTVVNESTGIVTVLFLCTCQQWVFNYCCLYCGSQKLVTVSYSCSIKTASYVVF